MIRLRFSNAFGQHSLLLGSVRVALSRATEGDKGDLAHFTAELRPGTNTNVRFGGESVREIPPHTDSVSDPIPLQFSFGDALAVSFTILASPDYPTLTRNCLGALSTVQGANDASGDESGDAFVEDITSRLGGGSACPFLNSVDLLDTKGLGAVAVIGDSLTEGVGSPEDGPFDKWPWLLAQRINAVGIRMGVLNMGIAGNTVTLPKEEATNVNLALCLDPGPIRFKRDVLQQTRVRTAIIELGGNDLRAFTPNPTAIISGLQNMVDQGHEAGLRVLLATIPPSTQSESGETRNDERRTVNAWIRSHKGIEDWLPFDETLRDPNDFDRIRAVYDSDGDNIHPEDSGRQALADSIPLDVL